MTDIFFSYSSADRERVRPIRDALAEQGFDVFWDQQVPAGTDWDTWIRQHLTKSKCVMAFWSATSVSSDNVRHEAIVAKQQGKLISVLLEPLTAEQFPMGLYAQQAANLSDWNGDYAHNEWRKFRREFEAKLTPLWVRRQIDEIEAELVGERTRREGAERRDRTMQAQIAKEVEVQQTLRRERDEAIDEVAKLKATVEELTRARAQAAALQAQVQQDLKQGRDKALDEVAALKATVEELTQARSEGEARQSAAQRRDAALRAQIGKEAEVQQALRRERDEAIDEIAALKTTVEDLTQARARAEARAVELSQHLRKVRLSKAQEIGRSIRASLSPFLIAAAVATVGFWTYQLIWSAPQPRLSTSEPASTQQSTADTKEAASVHQPVPTGTTEPAQQPPPPAAKEAASVQQPDPTTVAPATPATLPSATDKSVALSQSPTAAKGSSPNEKFDSGTPTETVPTNPSQPAHTITTGLFTIKPETAASGFPNSHESDARTPDECERVCARSATCKVFTFDKSNLKCLVYSRASDVTTWPNAHYVSGIRR
jgi:TIR domain/PAN domain